MALVIFQEFGAKKGSIGVVDTGKLQLVYVDATSLTLGYIDGTMSVVPVIRRDVKDKTWHNAVNNKMMFAGQNLALDMSRIAEIQFFPHGDPQKEEYVRRSEIRVWFDCGEFHMPGDKHRAEELMKLWMNCKYNQP
jgi:hypothetical protein